MNQLKAVTDPELAIWERVFIPDLRRLTAEQAHYLLQVSFPESDIERINELSTKANRGTLEGSEKVELERFVRVGHLLSILKAKVRRRLKKAAS